MIKKLHFVIDKTIKNNSLKKIIFKKYTNFSPKNSDAIIVVGGDGFMLQTLKRNRNSIKYFYQSINNTPHCERIGSTSN